MAKQDRENLDAVTAIIPVGERPWVAAMRTCVAAIILSAELLKPARFEFNHGIGPSTYVIYDRETGRATPAEYHSKNPTAALEE